MRTARAWIIALALFILYPGGVDGQIINTLAGFEDGRPGWSGASSLLLSLTGGNTEVVSLGGSGRIQWQSSQDRLRLLVDGKRKSSQGERIDEAVSVHLRHNHRLRPWLYSLAFMQGQQNLFQRLRERYLFGLGARIDLIDRRDWRVSLGAASMLEIEKIEGAADFDQDARLSSFLSINGRLNEHVEISSIAFVQPLWKEFTDARAIAAAAIDCQLIGPLSLVTAANLQYDSEPPESVKTTDWSLESGLSLSF